jgi:hypothetical protein
MRPEDRARVKANPWVDFLDGKNPGYPEASLQRDLESIAKKVAMVHADQTRPDQRLADNMLDMNPAATESLVRLMFGGLIPGRDGGLLNARLRYFDPDRRRAGIAEDVAALISEVSDGETLLTLVNVSPDHPRAVVVQAGGYGEHRFEAVDVSGRTIRVNDRVFTVRLAPGAGATLRLTMRRYVNPPTAAFPWDRS